MSNFRPFDRDTGYLLPPSVDEWLPQKHLARFVVEVIDGLDLSVRIPVGRVAADHLRPLSATACGRLLTTALSRCRPCACPNQKGIVTRTEDNELEVAANSQWAGALDDNVTKVIVADLSKLLGTAKVVCLSGERGAPLSTASCKSISRGSKPNWAARITLAQWIIFGDGGRSYMQIDGGSYMAPASDGDYRSIAAAMSRALGDLSGDIATSLAPASSKPKPSS